LAECIILAKTRAMPTREQGKENCHVENNWN
jgi:hypothetical protein